MNANTFTVHFLGTRGSTTTDDKVIGGQTSCLVVYCGGYRLILDSGSGIRLLNSEVLQEIKTHGSSESTILYSHGHDDHLTGITGFKGVFNPNCHLNIIGGLHDDSSLEDMWKNQFKSPRFPVPYAFLGSKRNFIVLADGAKHIINTPNGDIEIEMRRMNHPGKSYGYRITFNGRVLALTPDHEPHPELDVSLVQLWKGADLLITEVQYTDEEYLLCKGWGHDHTSHAAALLRETNVKRVATIHHDPDHSPEQIRDMAMKLEELSGVRCDFAYDGLWLTV